MERVLIRQSKKRLLLNAEPFGFGPSAAVASIFPHLRKMFKHVGFMGKGHTLDVQEGLDYQEILDISGLSPEAEEKRLKEIASNYDVFFTAMDFPLAKRMHDFGIQQTCRYDALTWYWPQLPEALGKNDLYLAQDFLGVRERLQKNSTHFAHAHIVPPLVPNRQPKGKGDHFLINLGGLQNPFWTTEQTTKYAKRLIAASYEVSSDSKNIIIATSKAIAEKLGSPKMIYSREEMKRILATSKYAFMTPGLGNIYDSAIYNIPTVWLPPANDSQGRQLDLLRKNEMIDGSVDWSDLGRNIDYYEKQTDILQKIADAVRNATIDALASNLERGHSKIIDKETSATTLLLDRFGTNGEEKVAKLIYQFAEGSITYSAQ